MPRSTFGALVIGHYLFQDGQSPPAKLSISGGDSSVRTPLFVFHERGRVGPAR